MKIKEFLYNRLSRKLPFLIFVTPLISIILTIFLIIGVSYFTFKKNFEHQKEIITQEFFENLKKVTKQRVNLAYNILEVLYNYYKNKPHGKEKTIYLMRKIFDKMRWGKTGYIFVLDFHGNTIYHPNKKFMHENRWNLVRHGIKIVQLLTFEALKHPNGVYVKYWAYNPLGRPILKISYLKVFKPLHFFIGSGIYLDKLNKTLIKKQQLHKKLFERFVRQILIAMVLILVIVLIVTAFISYIVKEIFKKYEKELEEERNKLFEKAIHDNLTGLYNKEAFKEYLKEDINKAKREHKCISVVFIDLDRFKEINDTFGHEHGDKLLKIISKRLKKCVRNIDKIARFGGDEFVILLNDVKNKEYIAEIIQRILDEIKKPIEIDGKLHHVSASIGISLAPVDSDNPDVLLKNADIAMYKAKQEGKNRFEFFTENLSKLAQKRLKIKEIIHQNIENNGFIIHFQPQFDKNDKLYGSEVLVRCKNPDTGELIPPNEFIPVAIETGYIDKIDLQVIEKAIIQYQEWLKKGYNPGVLSCNVTIYELEKTDFENKIKAILDKYNFNPVFLNIEVTEESVMRNAEISIKMLEKINKLGIKINVDDFGTGYSSLSYLKKLPISKIKIDREFIKDIPYDKDDVIITKTIINLAKNMGLGVIAEGVENEIQKNFVFENGCDYVQGFYYSKPVPADEFEKKFLSIRNK